MVQSTFQFVNDAPSPRPFLKWAGGKSQLLDELVARVRQASPFKRYHEPFLGGGALFFELHSEKLLGNSSYLYDTNEELIVTYVAVRDHTDEVIKQLEIHAAQNSSDYFYTVRERQPVSPVDRAARVIYLNKTCFNGLFRQNSRGRFNVPFGRYKDPKICDPDNLHACAAALRDAQIEVRDFRKILQAARPGDLVYFDPPYHPLSKTASFTAYFKDGFSETDQRALADIYGELDRRGVKVLLSNSDTELIRSLYRGFHIETVYAKRSVNSRADRRGKIAELLSRNF